METINITTTVSTSDPTGSFTLPAIVDDRIAELGEHYTLRLAVPEAHTGALVLGSPATRRVTISDNDMLEVSITPNAESFVEQSTEEPGMTLHAKTRDTRVSAPMYMLYKIKVNQSTGLLPLSVLGNWTNCWSSTPDEDGYYTASKTVEQELFHTHKMGLSTEPMDYSIEVFPSSSGGYTVAPAPEMKPILPLPLTPISPRLALKDLFTA